MKWISCFVLLGVVICCQAAAPGPDEKPAAPDADAPAVHEASGMEFPSRVAGFLRKNISRFDATGRDIGITYKLPDPLHSILATVYIYPPPEWRSQAGGTMPAHHAADPLERNMLCAHELDARRQELHAHHPESTLADAKPATLEQNGSVHEGYHISFNSYELFGAGPQNVSSDFYLFCYATVEWMIAYRFTYPAKTEVGEAIGQFMRELGWPRER